MRITRFLPLLLVCLAIPVRAQQNNQDPVRMVTYFPAPYVAYSTLNVDHSLQVGLKGNVSPQLVIGSADMNVSNNNNQILNFFSTSPAQSVGGIVVDNGSLGFQSDTTLRSVLINPSVPDGVNPVMTLGSTDTVADYTAVMHFGKNLQINTSRRLKSFYTTDLQVTALNLFGLDFPSCGAINGTGEMRWEALTLSPTGGQAKLYLTCFLSDGCTPGDTSTQTKLCNVLDQDQCGGQLTRSVTCNENGVWEGPDWDMSSCTPRPEEGDPLSPLGWCQCANGHVDLPDNTDPSEVNVRGTVFHNREIVCEQNSSGQYVWQVANANNGHEGWDAWWDFSVPTPWHGVLIYPCLGWQAVEDKVQYHTFIVGCPEPGSDRVAFLPSSWRQGFCTAEGNETWQLKEGPNCLLGVCRCVYRHYRCVHLHVKPWEPLGCQ